MAETGANEEFLQKPTKATKGCARLSFPPEDHRAVERNETQGISRENAKMNTKFHNKASKAAKMRNRKFLFVASAALL